MWGFFIFVLCSIALAIVLLLLRYSASNVPLVVKITTAYAWLTTMWVVALVPIDVWSTLAHKGDSEERKAIGIMWKITYWMWTSLKENAILYGILGVISVIGVAVIIVVEHLSFTALLGLGMGLSNTACLVAILLCLGWGLVELPRQVWRSKPEYLLKWYAHRAGRLGEEVIKTTKELDTVVSIIYANQRQMPRRDPLRLYMDIIAESAEKDSPVKPSHYHNRNVDIESLAASDLDYNYDKKGLANLRRRLHNAIDNYRAAHVQYSDVITIALELEEVVKCREMRDYTPRSIAGGKLPTGKLAEWVWYYKCVVRPWERKLEALILVGLSGIIVWSEITIPVGETPNLSPISLAIHKASVGSADHTEIPTQLVVLLPLAYCAACSYMALFSITAFNYNKVIKGATSGAGLMQNGAMFCRFVAPLCWNYLFMIRMTAELNDVPTVFSKIMGEFALLPAVDKHINQYLPLILGVQCTLVLFNIWDRVIYMCVPSRYKFSNEKDYDDTYTEKGRELVRKEQESLQRGFRLGEILHSNYLDIANTMGFSLDSQAAPAPSRSASKPASKSKNGSRYEAYKSRKAEEDEGNGAGGATAGKSSLLSSLVNNKHGSSAVATPTSAASGSGAGGSSRGGLDGLFAELSKPAGGPARPTRLARQDDEDDSAQPILKWGGRRK